MKRIRTFFIAVSALLSAVCIGSCTKEDRGMEEMIMGVWYVDSVSPVLPTAYLAAGDRLSFFDDMVLELYNRWQHYFTTSNWMVLYDKVFKDHYLKLYGYDEYGEYVLILYGRIEELTDTTMVLVDSDEETGVTYRAYLSR